jgi:hypothetical protein
MEPAKRTIGVVACSKSKLNIAAAAQYLYQGHLFRCPFRE